MSRDQSLFRNRILQALPCSLVFLTLISLALFSEAIRADEKVAPVRFETQIHQWISLTSFDERSGLREVCGSLARAKDLSIVLDRRLDPNRPVKISSPVEGSTVEILTMIADSQNAELRILGDSLLLLSRESASRLRTLVAIRTTELSKQASSSSNTRKLKPRQIQKVMARIPRQWDDLAQPGELVLEAAKRCQLKIKNPELIPHDLWYRGQLPRANMIEFLSFVLVQYDLTFSWNDSESLVLEKTPQQIAIQQTHRIPKDKYSQLSKALLKEFPRSQWKPTATQTQVSGPVELHERIKSLLSNKQPPKVNRRIPWKKKRYTMRVVNKPVGEVLDYLISTGLPILIDKQQIEVLEIDMKQLVSFETKEADASQLIEAICQPIKLPFNIRSDEIHIGKTEK